MSEPDARSDIPTPNHPEPPRTANELVVADDLQKSIAELVLRAQELRKAGDRLSEDVDKLRAASSARNHAAQFTAMSTTPTLISEDEIAAVAKRFWEEEGQPEGKAKEHWFRAEALLHQRQITAAAGAPVTPVPAAPVGLS